MISLGPIECDDTNWMQFGEVSERISGLETFSDLKTFSSKIPDGSELANMVANDAKVTNHRQKGCQLDYRQDFVKFSLNRHYNVRGGIACE
ncbi:hypothetical protein TNCV_2553511 [Trichonephila clavipes]|nr:hypothetical protein TNCV_2553511 [Trichonephila clavipes]